ncbi:hypothetical protein AAFF_G00190300 [Aldrovandia affinis]|uniref:Uncharacterized protein n=1 Tax=Aldrovandia affinis TaxID=143900 RepID=A0AAD7RJG2_9TELE|nr:hypothetical protein AAFF_G00190300 [Aldrovandia affinis]
MKAAIRASLKDDSWCDQLPWVLLGIRTAPKEDLQSSSAELLYGLPLHVPQDFIPNASVPWSASLQRSTHLSRAVAFVPVPMSRHGRSQFRVPGNLCMVEFIFVRHNAHRGPLQPPYDDPFRVLEPGKTFVIDIRGKPDHVSVDCLKPAHREMGRPVGLAQRRGRPDCQSSDPARITD